MAFPQSHHQPLSYWGQAAGPCEVQEKSPGLWECCRVSLPCLHPEYRALIPPPFHRQSPGCPYLALTQPLTPQRLLHWNLAEKFRIQELHRICEQHHKFILRDAQFLQLSCIHTITMWDPSWDPPQSCCYCCKFAWTVPKRHLFMPVSVTQGAITAYGDWMRKSVVIKEQSMENSSITFTPPGTLRLIRLICSCRTMLIHPKKDCRKGERLLHVPRAYIWHWWATRDKIPQTGNEWKRALDFSVAGGETSVTSSFLQKQKAHLLTNSPPRDFYAQKISTRWMMWNWIVAGKKAERQRKPSPKL